MGKRVPKAMAIPPLRGMGCECIFLASGMSRTRKCTARLLKSGIRAIVVKVEMSRVDKKIIEGQPLAVYRARIDPGGARPGRRILQVSVRTAPGFRLGKQG